MQHIKWLDGLLDKNGYPRSVCEEAATDFVQGLIDRGLVFDFVHDDPYEVLEGKISRSEIMIVDHMVCMLMNWNLNEICKRLVNGDDPQPGDIF